MNDRRDGVNPYHPPQVVNPDVAQGTREASQNHLNAAVLIAASAGGAFAIGAGSRAVRPLIRGPIHYDAIGGLLLMGCVCVGLVVACWRLSPRRRVFCYCIGIVSVWLAHSLGWSFVHGQFWGDLWAVNTVGCLVATIIGGSILIVHRFWNVQGR